MPIPALASYTILISAIPRKHTAQRLDGGDSNPTQDNDGDAESHFLQSVDDGSIEGKRVDVFDGSSMCRSDSNVFHVLFCLQYNQRQLFALAMLDLSI